jgi:small basic protein (TIGR04137 family)
MLSNRNVLKRAERLEKLKETERWQEGDSIFGLPKVKIQKVALKRKKKVKKLDDADEAATEAAPDETDT